MHIAGRWEVVMYLSLSCLLVKLARNKGSSDLLFEDQQNKTA
jgi:hypothetical protein